MDKRKGNVWTSLSFSDFFGKGGKRVSKSSSLTSYRPQVREAPVPIGPGGVGPPQHPGPGSPGVFSSHNSDSNFPAQPGLARLD